MIARFSTFCRVCLVATLFGPTMLSLCGCGPTPMQTGAEDSPTAVGVAPPSDTDLKGAKSAADAFLAHLEHHDFDSAVDSMTVGARQFTAPTTLSGIVGAVEKKHGKVQGHTGPTKTVEESGGGSTTITVTYDLTVEHGSSAVSLVVLHDAGVWRTQSFQFTL